MEHFTLNAPNESSSMDSIYRLIRSVVFWDVTQRILVGFYSRQRAQEEISWTLWPLKMGPKSCHETPVRN